MARDRSLYGSVARSRAGTIQLEATIDDDHPEIDEPLYPVIWRLDGPDGTILGTGLQSTTKSGEGEHVIYVEYGSASDSVTITVEDIPNTAPTASIDSPADGDDFTHWDQTNVGFVQVDFFGSGSDAEDGSLTGTSLEWSNREVGTTTWRSGGTGTTTSMNFSWSCDNWKFYEIRLEATDSEGFLDTDTIEIGVQSPAC